MRALPFASCLLAGLLSAGCAPAPERAEVRQRIDRITEDALRAHVEALTRGGPRVYSDAAATERTLAYLEAQLGSWGYRPRREPLDAGVNLLAELPGEEPGVVVEIGAHYDSVPGSPGADDNGSGVAGVLETARAMAGATCLKSVRFCFFAAEEPGLLGSFAHVEAIRRRTGVRVEGILNLEMIGFTSRAPGSQRTPARIPFLVWPPRTGDFITVAGNVSSGGIGNRFEAAAASYVPDLRIFSVNRIAGFFGDAARSDHYPYWMAGYRGIMLTDTANFRNPNYHRPTDTLETLDLRFMRQVTQAAAAAMMDWTGLRDAGPAP